MSVKSNNRGIAGTNDTISVGELITLLSNYPKDMPIMAVGGGCFLYTITNPIVEVRDGDLVIEGYYDC